MAKDTAFPHGAGDVAGKNVVSGAVHLVLVLSLLSCVSLGI